MAEVDDPERPFDNGPEMGRRPRHLTDPRPAPPVETTWAQRWKAYSGHPHSNVCGDNCRDAFFAGADTRNSEVADLYERLAAAESLSSGQADAIIRYLNHRAELKARLARIEKAARVALCRLEKMNFPEADALRAALPEEK